MPGLRAVSMPVLLAVFVAVLVIASGVEASEHELLCNLPKDPGPCEDEINMFYFNAKTGNCEQFSYGGCEGNKNRFDTKAECEKRCKNTIELCPVVPTGTVAHCAEMCPASGCPDGKICCSNGCGHTCQYPVDKPTKPMVHVCCLEEDPGPCKGYFKRYYFNKTEKKCMEFIYGGCGGNGNNFKCRAECQKMCK